MKAQTKAVVASIVVVALALSAISGVTYSWFSDSETSNIDVSAAKVDIDGKYTGAPVVEITNGTTGADISTTASLVNGGKDIEIKNLVSNRTITANYELTNKSTINVLYRMYIQVSGISDENAKNMISLTGGNDPVKPADALNFVDGIAYVVGGESGVKMSVPGGSVPSTYGFILKIESGNYDFTDFSIKIVNEAYQTDFTYSKVQGIINGSASLPTTAVTDSISFTGTAPAETGAEESYANITFSSGAINKATDNGTKTVTLKTQMLNPDSDLAKIKLTLEGTDQTDFGSDTVTVSLSIPGNYSGLNVVYNGLGAQPTDVKCVYDSARGVTDITFSTTHFSEFKVVAGEKSTATVNDEASLTAATSAGIRTITLSEDIVVSASVVVESKCTINLNGYTISNNIDIWNDGNWSLISVRSNGDLTINGSGSLKAKANDCYAVDVQDGSNCIINGGEYIGNIHAVYVHTGSVLINGGKYSVTQKYPQPEKADEFVINLLDKNRTDGTAKAIITGGTFVKFNPSDCWAEGEHTNFLAEGYFVTNDADNYVVKPCVAKIGDVYYNNLSDALKKASEDAKIELLDGVTVTLDNGVANEGNKSRTVTIVGNGTQTVDVIAKAVKAEGGMLNYQRGSSFTFKNLTIQAGEGSFDGIVCDSLIFENCIIKGKLTLYGAATFTDCTFDNDMANQYSIWTWGGTDVTFDGCTFNTNGKAILLYGSPADKSTKLTVSNCIFNDRNNGSAGKAAIEIGNDYGATYTLTISDISINGFADGKNTGSNIWANKNSMDAKHLSVTINGVKIL